MTKEEAIQHLKDEGTGTFKWVMNLAIFFIVIALLSPLLLIWVTFGLFIKVAISAIFMWVVCALAWGLIKKLIGEIAEDQYQEVIKKRKSFQDRMKEKMNESEQSMPEKVLPTYPEKRI